MTKKEKIIIGAIILILLLPTYVPCGHVFYSCATAPDDTGYYYTFYEVEPLAITIIETVVVDNFRFYYWRGKDAHFIGN